MNIWSHRFSQNMNEKLAGQKSCQFFVHILGETMTSQIPSAIYWPLLHESNLKDKAENFSFLSARKAQREATCTKGSETIWSRILKYPLTGNFTTRVRNWKIFSRLTGWINVANRQTGFFLINHHNCPGTLHFRISILPIGITIFLTNFFV